MGISSLSQVLTSEFITSVSQVGQADSAQSNPLSSSSSKVDLSTSLRLAARNFSYGLQALNVSISFINVSRSIHENMGEVVDRMIEVVEKAGRATTGFQTERKLLSEFEKLSDQFSKIADGSVVQGLDVLDMDTLKQQMKLAGLDADSNSDIQELFNRLQSLTSTHVDNLTGEVVSESATIPLDDFRSAVRRAKNAISGGDTPDPTFFSSVRRQLNVLKDEIDINVKYLNQATDLISKNMTLVRVAGLAFLELSDQVSGEKDAELVALDLQSKIRSKATQALSQAGNLEPIVLAGVNLVAAQSSNNS